MSGKISQDTTVPFKSSIYIPGVDLSLAVGFQNVKLRADTINGPWITPQQYGAVANGSDCTAAITTMLSANPLGMFYFPPGTYGISTQITVGSGQFIVGAGPGVTVFNVLSATADIFALSGSGTAWGGMSGFSMTAGVPRTAGRYIYDTAGFPTVVENFSLNGAFIGIELATAICYYRNGSIRDTKASTGIVIKVSGGNDHFINNVVCDNPIAQCAAGLQIVQSGGTFVSSCDFIRCGIGVALIPQNGNAVDWCSFTDVYADTNSAQGWLFECAGTGAILGAVLENCWSSSNSTDGVFVDKSSGTIDNISLSNFRCINNGANGINLVACTHWTQIGGTVAGNSQGVPATQSGIAVAATCDHVILKGIQLGTIATFGDTHLNQITLGNGIDFVQIEGCNLSTSHTPIGYSTFGNNSIIRNNFGFVNEFHGTGQVNNGTTSNTVPHGLTITPAVADIVISPLTSMASVGINSAWVSAAGATTFTVSVNTAPSSPYFFSWAARTAGAR